MLDKIKSNIGSIFIGITIIIVFLLGRSCGKKELDKTTKVEYKTTITSKIDTIFPKDTIYVFKDKPLPYPVYLKGDTIKIQPIDSLQLYRFFIYKDSIEDKNIKIYSTIVTQGKTLNSFKPSYKLKVPLLITDTIRVTKRDSVIIEKPQKYQISAGLIASPKMLAPMLDLSINRSNYSIGYDPFNKLTVIGYKFKLIGWNPRKKK